MRRYSESSRLGNRTVLMHVYLGTLAKHFSERGNSVYSAALKLKRSAHRENVSLTKVVTIEIGLQCQSYSLIGILHTQRGCKSIIL